EWSGVVVETGRDVGTVAPGDRVVCEGMIPCYSCPPCKRGETHWCERIEAVGVVGVGTLGALAIALLRLHSPVRIVAYGVREEELELARQLGASDVAIAEGDGVLFEGELDLVVETAGAPAAVRLATALCRPGGRAVLLGIAGEGRTLTLPSDLLVAKDMALIGSIAYPSSVWSRVVGLVSECVLDLDPIVTHHFPASDFAAAIDLMDNRRGIVAKIVLEHGGASRR
ncbi:MAG: zinc-binding dehydrogenase, partial [Solirubrobacterales bacterium]|nr:zinc-binding dehydrogenase [Solirubrobacterales bacterium]